MNQEFLNTIFTIVVLPLLGVLTTYLVTFIKNKTESLKSKMANEDIIKYLDLAENTVIKAVGLVNQTYCDNLKESGKFDLEAQKIALQKTKSTVLSLLTTEAKSTLETVIPDLNKWIEITIENIINNK